MTIEDLIIHFEGWELVVYLDSAGYPTVGAGHLVRPGDHLRVGDTITAQHARELLNADLTGAEEIARQVSPPDLTSDQDAALVSLAYNIPAALAPGTGLRAALKDERLSDVPDEIRKWHKRRDPQTGELVSDPGLVRRRDQEARLFAGEPFDPAAPAPLRTLRRGDRGPEVEELQQRLGNVGRDVLIDGQFGPQTEAAIRFFQMEHNLTVDGIAGPEVFGALVEKGKTP